MTRRILHPSDFSPASRAAFAKAVELAKQDRAQLILAHVLSPVMPYADGFLSAQDHQAMEEVGRRYGRKHLAALVTKAKKAGVRASALLLEGVVADRIVRAAKGHRADLIVIGTHGRTGLARFMLGSVADRVVSHAGCPVLTVRGREGARA
jgi:nucleotide-binding universal stress UspA family protein